jgi:microcystin-dependent protein
MDAFIGEIRLFPYTFPPYGWAWCNGQQMSVQQYAPLAAVIGFQFGGDGKTTFKLPDLRGLVAVGAGDDPTDTFDPSFAAKGGGSGVILNTARMPSHTHDLTGALAGLPQRVTTPAGNLLTGIAYKPTTGTANPTANPYAVDPATPPTVLAAQTLSPFVGGTNNVVQAHENRQPVLVLQWAICVDQGSFPVRSN